MSSEWTDAPDDVEWNAWGPSVRVRVDHARLASFARANAASGHDAGPAFARSVRRGPMEVTWFQTRWTDLDGTPVVDEQIVSRLFPNG